MDDARLDFEKLYRQFHPQIVRYLARLAGPSEAEDLAQEAFAKVASGLGGFKGDSQLSTWIYRIATNTALDAMRRSSFRRMAQSVPFEEPSRCFEGNAIIADEGEDAAARIIRHEMEDCIRGFIDRLPDHYRTVIILSELEGLPNGEIAAIAGVSLDTVKIRLHRARKALKKELGSHCSFYLDHQSRLACDLKASPSPRKK